MSMFTLGEVAPGHEIRVLVDGHMTEIKVTPEEAIRLLRRNVHIGREALERIFKSSCERLALLNRIPD